MVSRMEGLVPVGASSVFPGPQLPDPRALLQGDVQRRGREGSGPGEVGTLCAGGRGLRGDRVPSAPPGLSLGLGWRLAWGPSFWER